jgi:hypothetical protein
MFFLVGRELPEGVERAHEEAQGHRGKASDGEA